MASVQKMNQEDVAANSLEFHSPRPSHILEGNSNAKLLDLPEPLLTLISEKLIIKDQIFFGAVCKPLQSIYNGIRNQQRLSTKKPRLPLLVFPTEEPDSSQTWSFYNISEKRVCDFKVPVARNQYWPASSKGWLAIVGDSYRICLLNPSFKNSKEILLPPLYAIPGNSSFLSSFHMKVVVSENPLSNFDIDVVMAIYGPLCRLAFLRPGDSASWTTVTSEFINVVNMEDVIYSSKDRLFYVVNWQGEAFACNVDRNLPHPTITKKTTKLLHGQKRYLVESASTGDLLHVVRFRARRRGFHVFKLDPDTEVWIQMNNLQGCMLFLGDNSSFSLFAPDYPGFKPNTIYFTDDHRGQNVFPPDMGVFDIDEGTVTPYHPVQFPPIATTPFWIEDRLHD